MKLRLLALFPCFLPCAAAAAQVVFPKPAGPYPVGTTLFHWVDPSRDEILTPEEGDKRELMVQLWYPIAKGTAGDPVRYLPHFDELREVLSSTFRAHERRFARAEVPAIAGAPPLPGRPLPVIVFSHGMGTSRLFYTSQILALASHGYLVAAPDHTYDVEGVVFPGPRLVERFDTEASEAEKAASLACAAKGTKDASERLKVWAADSRFVLDRLEKLAAPKSGSPFSRRLDLAKVGMLGHCYGAEAAMLACSQDSRFKAVVNEDGWPPATEAVAAGLKQPLLFLWGEFVNSVVYLKERGVDDKTIAALVKQFRDVQTRILKRLGTTVYFVEIAKQRHMDFTDLPMLAEWIGQAKRNAVMRYPARVPLVNSYTVAFFDEYLRGRKAKLLRPGQDEHAGVRFEVFGGKADSKKPSRKRRVRRRKRR